ncbi:MAG: LytTR family DNA-binding domain-containing protein [Lachnospiraceae bacterium]|nr:LytTR family DNA-binding domain-containing protein [Lachnospiraceae bacterium]
MINIAVCDDEKCMIEKIEKMAEDFFRNKNTDISVAEYTSGEELLRSSERIDILFLDIGMRGMDGIETARMLRAHGYNGFLIFITVLKEVVFQSFEVQPFDYLVKPVQEEHFEKTMERLFLSMQDRLSPEKVNLLVRKGCESDIISFQDIICCEIIDRKVYLYLVSGEVIDYYERIENLEKKLDGRFFRCHRSYLINLNHLKSYRNNTAYMSDGKEIPVSRLRSKEFSKVILQYMREWRL